MSTKFSSRSPIDGSVVFSGEASAGPEIDAVIRHSATVGKRWRTTVVDERMELVRRYCQYLEDHREEIAALLVREVGKLGWDAAGEVTASIAKGELSISALQQRRSEQTITDGQSPQAVVRRIRYQPLGVMLVLGPFNFPLHLPGGQIIPALLAGNTVVFKPSDKATAVGQWMTEAWHKIGLPDGVLQMITGGVETASTAIDSAHIAAVCLTGSRVAGRAIHRQLAGRPDVLLALELGGNNPIVVNDDLDPEIAAKIVSFSAFISAGQRCTCARRATFMQRDAGTAQIDALVEQTRKLRVGMPSDQSRPQIGPLINEAAADSVKKTYERLLQLGCRPLIEFSVDAQRQNLVRPAIVDASGLAVPQQEAMGELEWFGPLLVIERCADFESALSSASRTPYGLAASLLGGDRQMFHRFAVEIGAGVVNWNGPTTGAAGNLPFGGLGDSGNHRPAGFFAIDFCSDPVASLERDQPLTDDPWSVVK